MAIYVIDLMGETDSLIISINAEKSDDLHGKKSQKIVVPLTQLEIVPVEPTKKQKQILDKCFENAFQEFTDLAV